MNIKMKRATNIKKIQICTPRCKNMTAATMIAKVTVQKGLHCH